MSLVFAGIGSRSSDVQTCELMTKIAAYLKEKGYWLRTGAADGADLAFGKGGLEKTIYYLPWETYNADKLNYQYKIMKHSFVIGCTEPTEAAINLAGNFHPAWDKCSSAVRKMHGRNMHIISGINLDSPVRFVVLWTPEGKKIGGTSQAWNYAEHLKIPVYNLFNKDYNNCLEFINNIK